MKLSFVIPAYNEEAHIGACLDSILREIKNKPYEVEIVVANNASTDKTKEVAMSYPGVIVVDEPHKGMVWARHAAYAASSGDLLANIDADTRLTKGWVDKVMAEFTKKPKLVALSGPYIFYDMPWHVNFLQKIFYRLGYILYIINRFILRLGSMLQGGNFVVRREAIEKIGGYDTTIDFYGEDTDLARRLHYVGPVKFTFNLPMETTGRRLKHEGVIRMGIRYSLNYLWMIFFKKPYSKEYIDVRHNANNLN